MSVAHFFESGQRPVLRCAEREATANGRASSLAQHSGYIACDRQKRLAGHVGSGPAVRSPQRSGIPTETAREQSTRGASQVILGAGGSQPVRPPGHAVSSANFTPAGATRLGRPAVIQ